MTGRGFAVGRKKKAYNGNGMRVPVQADGQNLCDENGHFSLHDRPKLTVFLSLSLALSQW